MKQEHFMILFSALLITGMLVVGYTTKMSESATDLTLTYREFLDTAVEDAVNSVIDEYDIVAYSDGSFWNEETMSKAEDTLFNSLTQQFGYAPNTGKDEFYQKIPVLMYIDYDGFYAIYMDTTEDSDGHSSFKKNLSKKFTWEEDLNNGAHIRYTTGNLIYVTMPDGTSYKGNYDKVYKRLEMNGKSTGFDMLKSESEFEDYRTKFTIAKMENNLNYFINKADTTSDRTGYYYNVHMDYTNDELQYIKNNAILQKDPNSNNLYPDGSTGQIINNIGLVAFFQGPVTHNHERTINIYSMACRTFETRLNIPVTLDYDSGEFEYHDPRLNMCETIKSIKKSEKTFSSIENAAAFGAYPCDDCW